jgi:hypothetical protein
MSAGMASVTTTPSAAESSLTLATSSVYVNDLPGSVRSTLAVFSICTSECRATKQSGAGVGYDVVKLSSGFTVKVMVDSRRHA